MTAGAGSSNAVKLRRRHTGLLFVIVTDFHADKNRVIERGSTRINGFPAFGVLAEAQTQNRQIITLTTYFIEYRGKVYQFIGYAPQQLFGSFRSAFLQTIRGFGEIQDARILGRQPVRLSLERVSRSARVRDLIPGNLPAPFTPEEVAILNQVDLTQEMSPGKILKTPSAR